MPRDIQPAAHQLVPYLKERIYVSFIGLAVLLALNVHAEDTEAVTAVASLVIAAVGAGLAGLISEIVAHLAVKGSLPDAAEMRFLVRVSSGSLATVVVPVVVLLLAALGVLSVPLALTVASWVMTVTLGAIGYIAVFRADLAWWKKLAVFVGLVLFGLVVVGVQLLAHG
jgi:hypothetical protein